MRVIALLRGVNVGGHNKVPMAELRALCQELGLSAVATYIASGNIAFDTDEDLDSLGSKLTRSIAARFQIDAVAVVLRRQEELASVLQRMPFGREDPAEMKRVYVLFLSRTPTGTADPDRSPDDVFVVDGREVFIRYGQGAGKTRLQLKWFERQLGCVATARNWRTTQRLLTL